MKDKDPKSFALDTFNNGKMTALLLGETPFLLWEKKYETVVTTKKISFVFHSQTRVYKLLLWFVRAP